MNRSGQNGTASRMTPPRQPSNGVPWLEWVGRDGWHCRGCGRSGRLPPTDQVSVFAAYLGDRKREHVACRPPGETGDRPGIGHPLNPDRRV